MADNYKIDDISSIVVSSRVMEELCSVSDRQVRNLAEDGMLVRNSHGKYLLLKSIKNYIMNLKIAKAGEQISSDFTNGELDLESEKAKHEHLKSMITELKLQIYKGQVHKSSDVGAVITDMFSKFRSKMTALPSKLAPKLQGKTKEEIKEILEKEITDALTELSEYNPADYYSDEYMEQDEDNILKDIDTEVANSYVEKK